MKNKLQCGESHAANILSVKMNQDSNCSFQTTVLLRTTPKRMQTKHGPWTMGHYPKKNIPGGQGVSIFFKALLKHLTKKHPLVLGSPGKCLMLSVAQQNPRCLPSGLSLLVGWVVEPRDLSEVRRDAMFGFKMVKFFILFLKVLLV